MSRLDDLSPRDNQEINVAVADAYRNDDGSLRTAAEAAQAFDRYMADAVQAHKEWAGVLLDHWRYTGMTRFIAQRWKTMDGTFGFTHGGRGRRRTVRRGRRVRDTETGRERWIQDELPNFTKHQLESAIAEAVRRIDEERANIAMLRSLIDLMDETGAKTVRAALAAAGKSLEEYLSAEAA